MIKQKLHLLRAALAGGFFVVLPVALVVFLLGEILDILEALTDPLAAMLPVDEVGGVETARWLGILLVIVLCLVAGLLVRTRLGQQSHAWFERVVLERVPGYTLIKSLTARFSPEDRKAATVVLVRQGGGASRALGFVADRLPDGRVAVFVPHAPMPTLGPIWVVPEDDIEVLSTSTAAAANVVMQWGLGFSELLPPETN